MKFNKLNQKNNDFKNIVVFIITISFFSLFLYAATSKIVDHERFKIQISKSPILTDFAGILFWLVPAVEVVISLLLIVSSTIGLYAAFTLMLMFTFYIIAILNFSESIPCSCGGILETMSWTQHLIFNIIFVILAVTAILLQTKIKENRALHKLL